MYRIYNFKFTTAEKANIHFVYPLAIYNSVQVNRYYAERYLQTHLPCLKTFTILRASLRGTGACISLSKPRKQNRNMTFEEQVLRIIVYIHIWVLRKKFETSVLPYPWNNSPQSLD